MYSRIDLNKKILHQWYWSYEYSDYVTESGESVEFDSYMLPESDLELGQFRLLDVDQRVIVPVDTHIRLIVTAADVLHDFAVPALGVKIDAVPGRLNQSSMFTDRLGVFYGQCSEICGVYHGFMVRGAVSIATKTKVFENSYQILPTSDLGMGESSMLNIACPPKGILNVSKCILQDLELIFSWLKLYCLNLIWLGFETWNSSLICEWLDGSSAAYGIYLLQDMTTDRLTRSQLEPESKEPKRIYSAISDTTGLPKGSNSYGSRGIVIPVSNLGLIYVSGNALRRGRIPGIFFTNVRRYSDGGHNVVPEKLVKLANICSDYPNKYVDRDIYKLMLDRNMFQLAYHKLKSKPGNMTPGLSPDTLDGLNLD